MNRSNHLNDNVRATVASRKFSWR